VVVPRASVVVVSPFNRQVFVDGRVFARPRVFVGSGVFFGGFAGPALYPYPYPYPVTYASPPVIQQETPTYAPSASTGQYWYYCPDSKIYYPYTQQCPSGWLQVVPSPPAPGPGR
jgi:hypothetical protein